VSGIAGFVNLDGAPADRAVAAAMMEAIRFRGPDAQDSWMGGNAWFGHTLLKTTDESENERQPFSLDGRTWIVADARIDNRQELTADLSARGQDVHAGFPDVELILRAWEVWRESCVEHLLGDFAFAIWDSEQQRLFCARDHLGIKQFYYARAGSCVVFSNTLDCIRRHPAVSSRLNDLAIADFLLFDRNMEPATTAFADIRKIPPAHVGVWDKGSCQLRRYWTLPVDEPVFYRRRQDYVDRFLELIKAAVADRLRIDRVGVFMSGGIDSPTLAAISRDLLRDRSGTESIRAFTTVQGEDSERHYAGLVASHLGIPIEFFEHTEAIDPEWFRKPGHTPEPDPWPTSLAAGYAYNQGLARHSRVVFFGEGPDNALFYEWRSYFAYLLRERHFGRLVQDVMSHLVLHRRLPTRTLQHLFRLQKPKGNPSPAFPEWLNSELESRLQLRARWQASFATPPSANNIRPNSYRSFGLIHWQGIFASFDAERTGACLEVRHPYLDLRVLRYLLAVPAVPWCRSKYLLRRSMTGILPKAVLSRPKTPVLKDVWGERMFEYGMPPALPAPFLERYVDLARVRETPLPGADSFWKDFRVRSLGYWLRNAGLCPGAD